MLSIPISTLYGLAWTIICELRGISITKLFICSHRGQVSLYLLPYQTYGDFMEDMINRILVEGQFPDVCMIARITPVFKNGDCNDPFNYRPIAILPILSKGFGIHINKSSKTSSIIHVQKRCMLCNQDLKMVILALQHFIISCLTFLTVRRKIRMLYSYSQISVKHLIIKL